MRKNWMQIITLCLCAVLLVVTIGQNNRLDEYQRQMEERMERLSESVSSEIQNISNSIEWELEEANRAVADHALEPVGIDSEKRVLLAEVSVALKAWYTDTEVKLLATVDGELLPLYLSPDGNGTYSGMLELPLEGDCALFLDALISGGGVTKQETLGAWSDFSMLLPLRNGGGGWSGPEYRDGVMGSEFNISIEGQNGHPGEVRNPEFYVYRNGELVQTLAAVADPYTSSDMGCFFTTSDAWSLKCDVGDEIEIRFRCEDKFGLGYDFHFQTWIAEGETPEDQHSGGTSQGGPALTLYWPE